MSRINLGNARGAKGDEFYTQMPEIELELSCYKKEKFQGKVVFCNCDNPFKSNFVKYFLMNFNYFELKELVATGYADGKSENDNYVPVLRINDTRKFLLNHQSDFDLAGTKNFLQNQSGDYIDYIAGNAARGEKDNIAINGKNRKQILYYRAGDFRSDSSIELLKASDIVVSNPPFSLFREYVAQLVRYEKQFLIIGNQNAITYREIFPLLRENKIWIGASIHSGDREFEIPSDYEIRTQSLRIDGDRRFIRVSGVRWFTNIDYDRRHETLRLDLNCKYNGNENQYPVYANYNAINIDKTVRIPAGYDGIMGVPITFLDKYCPEQFEIIGLGNSSLGKIAGVGGCLPEHRGKIRGYSNGTLYYLLPDGTPKAPYARILIRFRKQGN